MFFARRSSWDLALDERPHVNPFWNHGGGDRPLRNFDVGFSVKEFSGGAANLMNWKKAAVLTTLFWSASTVAQRISGLLVGMHSGRPYPLTVAWGVLSTACSLLAAQQGTMELLHRLPDFTTMDSIRGWSPGGGSSSWRKRFSGSESPQMMSRQEAIFQTMLGCMSYGLLERRNFRTTIPSSVIATGVYAHTPLHWRWSRMKDIVIASSDVATGAERARMQVLGKLHGCHHCGSRQLFSRSRFIADHMPPTLVVAAMNAKRWRKALGLRVKQLLLPQCQSCFSIQGAAVKQGVHRLVFHSQIRVWHLSPALALLAAQQPQVREALLPVAQRLDRAVSFAGRRLERWLDGYLD